MRKTPAKTALFVIGGYNGLKPVRAWIENLARHAPAYATRSYSWRDANSARREIAALSPETFVTLIGHSLGGGRAQALVQQLPAGAVDRLITVAPYGPLEIDHRLTRQQVGYWLNILPNPKKDWRTLARNIAAPALLGWQEQGWIQAASENYISEFPHHDFYKMITDRYGAAEQGAYRVAGLI